MVDLESARFLEDLAVMLTSELACTPADPIMDLERKERKQIAYRLDTLATKLYRQDERFSRLFLLGEKFREGRKEFAAHKFSIPQRIQWGKDLMNLVDTLQGLPERFETFRHPDHPIEITVRDRTTGKEVRMGKDYKRFLPMLTQLFGD